MTPEGMNFFIFRTPIILVFDSARFYAALKSVSNVGVVNARKEREKNTDSNIRGHQTAKDNGSLVRFF